MRQWLAFFVAAQRSFWRESTAVFWTFLMPCLLLAVLGSMFSARSSAFATIAIRDSDGGHWSARFGELLRATGWMVDEERGADAILELPPRFSASVEAGRTALLDLEFATPSLIKRNALRAALAAILLELNREAGVALAIELVPAPPPEAGPANPEHGYAAFILFGLAGLNVCSIALFGLGVGISWQRELGVLRHLWLTPASSGAYLAAQLASSAAIIMLSTAWLFGVGHLWFGTATPRWLPFAAIMVAGSLALVPIGLAIASRTAHPRNTQLWANLIYFPLMMMSGVYFRAELLGDRIARGMDWLPLKPFLDSLRGVSLGAPLGAFTQELAVMAGWSVVGTLLARGAFRWNS